MSLLGQAARLGLRRLAPARAACQTQWSQAYSAAPTASGDGDVVLDTFKEQQQQFRNFLEGIKKIPVPLSGDKAAVKKYAADMEALKRKVGMPQMEEAFSATLDYQLQLSGGNVRKFLTSATEGVDLSGQAEVVNALFAALDKVEASAGPIDPSNEKALKAFEKEAQAIAKQHKLDDLNKIKGPAIEEMYAKQLRQLRESAQEEIDLAKRRDGLEGINVDITQIKPKFTE